MICANSPQAKGRVERANQTLQDRLIKEMRLEGISSIEAANAWLDTFIADFNRRFARPAMFDKLECVDQGQLVDNKRLVAVLKLAQSKMDELERNGKRERSKKMPKRRAQVRVQE